MSRRWTRGQLALCLCDGSTGEPQPVLYHARAGSLPTVLDAAGAEHRCPTAELVRQPGGRAAQAPGEQTTSITIRLPTRIRDKLYERAGGKSHFSDRARKILYRALAPEEL